MLSIQCNSIFFRSSGFDCSEEVVDSLKTHKKMRKRSLTIFLKVIAVHT